MNQSIETRMDSIERQLKELRKEVEESMLKYKYPLYSCKDFINDLESLCPIPMTSEEWKNYTNESYKGANIGTKCLWDNIPIEDRMKPMGLSCPCRKCSAYC